MSAEGEGWYVAVGDRFEARFKESDVYSAFAMKGKIRVELK